MVVDMGVLLIPISQSERPLMMMVSLLLQHLSLKAKRAKVQDQ